MSKTNNRSVRRDLLEQAMDLVDGDRNVQYGDPTDDFRRTAAYWSIHAGGVLRRKIHEWYTDRLSDSPNETLDVEGLIDLVDGLFDAHDVAIMMGQLKASRLAWSPTKEDHWIDSAGYMACGWDCVSS